MGETSVSGSGAAGGCSHRDHTNALYHAIANKHAGIVTQLLAAKADPKGRCYKYMGEYYGSDATPLHEAIKQKNSGIVAQLVTAKADPTAVCYSHDGCGGSER